ncbi:MAG: hypothetical protein HY047_16425 [Acidobacteria bacterium]|nr:hypothetical protein [Acidobacteriota bacterium]
MRRNAPAGLDFEQRIRRQDFEVVVMRGAEHFPHDMDAGDAGFADDNRLFWADWRGHREMATLLESAYNVRAVRKPFVILIPRRDAATAAFP